MADIRKGLIFLLTLFIFICVPCDEKAPVSWSALESKGEKISRIEIEIKDIFDKNNPKENHFIGRLANKLHIKTKENVIRKQMLFKEGEKINSHLIAQSERNIRALNFVRDASIIPRVEEDGSITAVVISEETWTLKLNIKYQHVGGQDIARVRLHEVDLFGYGKSLLFDWSKTSLRTSKEIEYYDPNLFGSLWRLSTNYQNLSDGRGALFRIDKPFYSINTPLSVWLETTHLSRENTWFENGSPAVTFPETISISDVEYWDNFHDQGNTSLRVGGFISSEVHRYGSPDFLISTSLEPALSGEKKRMVGFGMWLWQDSFIKRVNVQRIGVTEDYSTGWDAKIKIGYMPDWFGNTHSGPAFSFDIKKGWTIGLNTLLQWRSSGDIWSGTNGYRANTSHFLNVYNKSFPYQTIAFSFRSFLGLRIPSGDVYFLGGEDGLRGYPNHFLMCDRTWLLTLEDRIITNWNLWGLFQAGFVAFADAGKGRLLTPSQPLSPLYSDVGIGLRFGNLKSAFGRLIVFEVAIPLKKTPYIDSYQIIVGNVLSF